MKINIQITTDDDVPSVTAKDADLLRSRAMLADAMRELLNFGMVTLKSAHDGFRKATSAASEDASS